MAHSLEFVKQLLDFINNPRTTSEIIDAAFQLYGGIGPEIAKNIVTERDRLFASRDEGFRSLSELNKVRLVGKRRIEGMLEAVEQGVLSQFKLDRHTPHTGSLRLPKQAKPIIHYQFARNSHFVFLPCLNLCTQAYLICLRRGESLCHARLTHCESACFFK
ncbi:helix-hairpin-helix domain-containing protein [Chloroflexi bacterium TSY]|nr:helix-hairpin-helix domain-containing protein [Chloroflexi bacterium TSY]